jgi:hypothetical protein
MIEAKAFRTFIRIYFLFRSQRLSAKIKLTLHKALIRSVMAYACTAWKFSKETYLFKIEALKVLHTIGNFPRCTPIRDLHTAFNLPYVYDYVTKLCRQLPEVIQNPDNVHVRSIGQGEERRRKYKRTKIGGGQAHGRSSAFVEQNTSDRHDLLCKAWTDRGLVYSAKARIFKTCYMCDTYT